MIIPYLDLQLYQLDIYIYFIYNLVSYNYSLPISN